MRTEYLTLDGTGDAAKIAHAVQLLKSGALVAFPTETVYGLGADARNPEAMARLSQVKGRKEHKSYSLLVPSLRHAIEAAGRLPPVALKLARVYWPGPLTIVLPQNGGTSYLGVRISEHPVARSLIAQCGFPLATPSANRMGTAEPVSAKQVKDSLDGEIALVLDGGSAWEGRSSTVVKVDGRSVQIQREGVLSGAEVLETACPTVLFVCTGNTCRSPMAAALFETLTGGNATTDSGLPVRVLSAGVHAREGLPADRLAMQAMHEINVDISRHRTRLLSFQLVDNADWIFTMTAAQRDCILELMPDCEARLRLLAPKGNDIPDPAACSLDLYRRIRDRIAGYLQDAVRVTGGKGV